MVGRNKSELNLDPPLHRKVAIVVVEQVYCLWLLVSGAVPVVADLFLARLRRDAIPTTLPEIIQIDTYSRLVGREVREVESAGGQLQLANSSGRDWIKIEEMDGKVNHVFAKIRAGSFFTTAMMSIFGVYKNECTALASGIIAQVEPKVATPTIYASKWSPSRFVILMEDLSRQGVKFPALFAEPGCTLEMAKRVLSTFAKIHAHYLYRPPQGVWNDNTRPYFGKVVGLLTFRKILRRLPAVVSPEIEGIFESALWHWDTVRAALSAAQPQTLCHGDSHLGNTFIQESGEVGVIDFQCVCQEHPMRDVAYFLASSYPMENIAQDEPELLRHYHYELTANLKLRDVSLKPPSLAECVEQQKLQCFYAMYAFVFSGGVPDASNLMDLETMGRLSIGRIAATMERIGCAEALARLLKDKSAPIFCKA